MKKYPLAILLTEDAVKIELVIYDTEVTWENIMRFLPISLNIYNVENMICHSYPMSSLRSTFLSIQHLSIIMELSVAIPASLVSDVPHLREQTYRIGMVGRALAIFRVGEVIVYPDRSFENQRHQAELISTILSYMETPQYLRKHLFPIMPTLRYASILPPLRTPNHPLTKRISELKTGDYRDGVIVKTGKETLVDIGVEHPIRLNEGNLPIGQRITVNIHKHKLKIHIKSVPPSEINQIYWGYRVSISNLTIGKILKDNIRDVVVLTSKYGKLLTEIGKEFKRRCREADKVLIAFGSPKQGLREILESEGYEMDDIDALVINTIPKQGTETVRTEEAIYATLAIINIII